MKMFVVFAAVACSVNKFVIGCEFINTDVIFGYMNIISSLAVLGLAVVYYQFYKLLK